MTARATMTSRTTATTRRPVRVRRCGESAVTLQGLGACPVGRA